MSRAYIKNFQEPPPHFKETTQLLIEIRHLRSIVAVARHASFRKAAEALHLGQPTLSRGVREVEEEFGVKLFRRSPRGTVPTEAGQEFIAYAQQILDELDSAISRVKSRGKGVGGRLIVGFYTSLLRGNLLALLSEQSRRRPDTELAIMNGARDRLLSALNAGTLDIAIMTDDRTRWDDGQQRVWSERVVVALPKGHRFASKSVLSWNELREETFLFSQTDPGPELQAILMSKLAPHGNIPRIAPQDAAMIDLMGLVRIGTGITLIWESSIGSNDGDIIYRDVHDGTGPSHGDFSAYWSLSNGNPALRAFLEGLRERYPGLPSVARPAD